MNKLNKLIKVSDKIKGISFKKHRCFTKYNSRMEQYKIRTEIQEYRKRKENLPSGLSIRIFLVLATLKGLTCI